MRILSRLSFVCLLLSPAFSQNPSKAPELDKLAFLAGSWTIEHEVINPETGKWTKGKASGAEAKWAVGDRCIMEEGTFHFQDTKMPLVMIYSFDPYQKVFRTAIMDGLYGLLDVYEGNFKDNKLVMTNLKSETFFQGAKGDKMAGKMVYHHMDANGYKVDYSVSYDEGKTWTHLYKIQYKRKK